MVRSINIRRIIENYQIRSTVSKLWYAIVDGKLYEGGQGQTTFKRKSDLVQSLKNSFHYIIDVTAGNYIAFQDPNKMTPEVRAKIRKMFWDKFIGEDESCRCQIKSISLNTL